MHALHVSSSTELIKNEKYFGQVHSNNFKAELPNILIVDDNKDIRQYVINHLSEEYNITEAISGNAALENLEYSIPDLIITDVMMPDGDGFFLLNTIRNNPEWAFLPVIFLTAKNQVEDKLQALEIGADAFLPKPFEMDELIGIIRHQFMLRKRLKAFYSNSESLETNYVFGFEHATLESNEESYLKSLFEIIQENLSDEKFSIESLAEKMNQSRSNLYRKVFALTKETPSNLLKRVRLERSAILLESRAGTVSEIAYSCGFNSIAHFSKIFKEKYGKSPSEYINSFIQEK
ncbi:response regulator with CheY-like receiver domain and winged-helix DNA-binding domain [Belliella baltica DSM 15883]|uniref:Response regulator with CheY-like receiver domain and winged-helix DNA-binding domain n=1 Tax=Belliella baltica (strain DSM 15883 / CIP 108006 / LMG 21964 / BA134) TaxID=866536 RepID=I3Z2W2_BELBD|nr:response regulator [Belliella baltica]AFL83580.1 response regulator with CheY-like receiver domain and winged-helix DNA-binding domain [Belliella baltica DSM 15883]